MAEIWELTLTEAAASIRERRFSPVEVVRALLDRIEQVEPRILAWTRLCPERALAEAERLERLLQSGTYLGPLHGIPLGIKDIFHTAGIETAAGSAILKGFVPGNDAAAVARLRACGAIVLGKTATTEFALFDPAPTRNPHNPEHTPGGSSSGSAAAVAAHMCFGALGSQTLGSILRPAAYCGVAGFKPTYDAVSREGVVPLAGSLDHVGPLARTVSDLVPLFAALRREATPEPAPARRVVAVPDRYFAARTDPEVQAAYEKALNALAGIGYEVRQVRLPATFEPGVEAGHVVMQAEAAAFHRQWFFTRANDYGPRLRDFIEAGLRVSPSVYTRAQQVREEATAQMRSLFQRIELLATPATPTCAPAGLASTGDPVFNAPFTIFGFPALAVPMGFSRAGLPMGIQLVADHHHDDALLCAGMAFEIAS